MNKYLFLLLLHSCYSLFVPINQIISINNNNLKNNLKTYKPKSLLILNIINNNDKLKIKVNDNHLKEDDNDFNLIIHRILIYLLIYISWMLIFYIIFNIILLISFTDVINGFCKSKLLLFLV